MSGRRAYELKDSRERVPSGDEDAEKQEAGAREAAYRLLGVRARSRRELQGRLREKGFPRGVVKATLDRLEELGFLNEREFARSLARARLARRPMGEKALRVELRGKGLEAEVVEEALGAAYAEEDVESLARRAARKKLPSLRGLAPRPARGKLEIFLLRRGFRKELARRTAESLIGDEILDDGSPALGDNIQPPEAYL